MAKRLVVNPCTQPFFEFRQGGEDRHFSWPLLGPKSLVYGLCCTFHLLSFALRVLG